MRIVIKIGTSTLTHRSGLLNIRRVEHLCKVFSDLKNAGHELVIVSSGAIGVGVGKLSLKEKPADIPTKQAAAAVGQCELMYIYDKLFAEYNHTVAQILITGEDIESPKRAKNFHNTIFRLLELGALPIINENDTIAVDEIVIGDNDTLGAIVASTIGADLLILLSDIDGLFTDFFEQRGDRACREDPAILGGIALFHGRPVTVIGTRKGKTLEENLRCNFGMPGPEGYRKALRLMKQAEKFGRLGAGGHIEAYKLGKGAFIDDAVFPDKVDAHHPVFP